MKNRVWFILTICFMTIILGSIVTVNAFTTTSSSGSSADSAKDNEWAYRAITGTRYVIRVDGEDLSGSKESWYYWMNHVQFYKRENAKNGNYYYDDNYNVERANAKVSEETSRWKKIHERATLFWNLV